MKKLITILTLVAALIAGGISAEAKTTRKSKAKTSQTASSKAIAKFTYHGTTYTMLAGGKIKSTNKYAYGVYEKRDNGAYYHVTLLYKIGDGYTFCLIVGDSLYYIDA